MAKGKQWRYLGNIIEQTAGKDSYVDMLDSGDTVGRHKRFIRMERGEKEDDVGIKECDKIADEDCTLRAEADCPVQERMKTRSTGGRIDTVHNPTHDEDEVP